MAKNFMPQVFCAFKALSVAHRRVLTLQGWKGPETVPKRGLPQGDGLSVVLAILWGWALQQCAQAADSGVDVLIYLDDISLSSPHATSVAKCSALVATYLWSWNVQLNASKSSVAFEGQVEEVPAAMDEFKKVSSFRLLGVNSGPSPCNTLLKERVAEANARLDRIAILSPPMNMVRRLIASFVVPVLYGSSFCNVDFPEWKCLVDRVHTMTYGTSRYAG
eukprot:3575862-Amphidinium_carterae.1